MRIMHFGLVVAGMACALAAAGCSGHAVGGASTAGLHDRGIHLAPINVDVTSQIQAVVDVRGISPTSCRYKWLRNGVPIWGESRDVLAPSNFRKGDVVAVDVTLPAGENRRVQTLKAEVRVADAAPTVTAAQVTMTASTSGCGFHAGAQCSDPDDDSTTCAYRWYRNGQVIDGATGTDLAVASMSRGDRITVEVVASDGERKSEPRRSPEFVLENRPPQFTSQPGAMKPGETVFTYQAVAVDPDGDPVHYELAQAPTGTTITPAGLVEWTLPPKDQRQGDGPIVIRATDSKGGETTQTIGLHVESVTSKRS